MATHYTYALAPYLNQDSKLTKNSSGAVTIDVSWSDPPPVDVHEHFAKAGQSLHLRAITFNKSGASRLQVCFSSHCCYGRSSDSLSARNRGILNELDVSFVEHSCAATLNLEFI